MSTSIQQVLNGLSAKRDVRKLVAVFNSLLTDVTATNTVTSTHTLNSAGLAIKTGGSAIVKSANTYHAVVGGVVVQKAASDMAALVGTVTNAKFNAYVFYVDAAGTLTTAMGTEGATLAAVVFPATPTTKSVIGFVIINPTGTGNFVGGTTALDDGTVVPTAVYVNTIGAFRPTATTLNTLVTVS